MESIERFKDDERRYMLLLDVRFGSMYNKLQARFYGHALSVISILQIVAGSAAMVSLATKDTQLAAVAGVIIAIVGAAGAVIDFGGRGASFREHARRYSELDALGAELSNDELARRLAALQSTGPIGEIEALSQPAFNANLRGNGRTDALVQLSAWQRTLSAFA